MIVFDQFSCKICFNGYGERRLFWGVMTVTVWGPGRPLSVPFLIRTSGKGTNKAKPAREGRECFQKFDWGGFLNWREDWTQFWESLSFCEFFYG